MIPFIFCIITAISTYLGGLFALKYVDSNHLLLSFAGGSIIGVCFFDLLPESMKIINHQLALMYLVVGFFAYYFVNHIMPIATPNQDNCENPKHKLGPWPMCLHSLFDGVAIGLAWHTGILAVGLTVALGVCIHDYCDGISIVCMLKEHWEDKKRVVSWLLLDALAPMVGLGLTIFIHMTPFVLGVFLAIFAGFFLYIGISFLIPEAHHNHSKFGFILSVIGMAIIYLVVNCV